MTPEPLKILIVRELFPHQQYATQGVQNFALSRPDWKLGTGNIRSFRSHPPQDILRWEPHGILVLTRYSRFTETYPSLPNIPIVTVDFHLERPEGIARVEVDEQAIGRTGAEFFIRQRFEHLGIVTSPGDNRFSAEREKGFLEEAAKSGRTAHRFSAKHFGGRPWIQEPDMDEWLKALPKPIGLYCTQDLVATGVLEHCKPLGIRVPSEVSLLGTDNYRINCESVRPFISSIEMPFVEAGYEAASLLAEHLQCRRQGTTPENWTKIIPPGNVVERQSTSLRMIPDPVIAKAANFLQDQALQGGTIQAAARHAGTNRRKLERGFQKHLGTSPGNFIQQLKLDHAQRLLSETTLPMWEIASACSMSQEYLTRFFKKETGLTPNAYRKQYRNSRSDVG